MGAANCCKKPDEIIVEEVKYSSTDNNKILGLEVDSYPQDTEQIFRPNINGEEEYIQGQIVPNQNLYEQGGQIGGIYEVPINVADSRQNFGEGMGQMDYDSLVNQIGNEANLKVLRMRNEQMQNNNAIKNAQGGIDLNALGLSPGGTTTTIKKQVEISTDKGGKIIKEEKIINQQNGPGEKTEKIEITKESQIKPTIMPIDLKTLPESFGSSDISNFKQITVTTTTKKEENANLNNIGNIQLKVLENVDLQNLPEAFGSNNINNVKETTTTTTTTIKKEGNLEPLDIKNFVIKDLGKIDLKDLPETFGSSDINNFNQTTVTKTTKIEKIENKDLQKTGEPANTVVTKKVETTVTTNTADNGKIESKGIEKVDLKESPATFGPKEIKTVTEIKTTSVPNVDKQPEATDKNNNKTTTTTTREKTVDPNNPENVKEVTTTVTTTTNGNIQLKVLENIDFEHLPEAFGSDDISHLKRQKRQ